MTDAAPWYYPVFVGQTREAVIDTLGLDAFEKTAEQIVLMLLIFGYAPDVLDRSREPLQTPGVTIEVRQEGRVFWVSVDEEASTIAVQEVADKAYADE